MQWQKTLELLQYSKVKQSCLPFLNTNCIINHAFIKYFTNFCEKMNETSSYLIYGSNKESKLLKVTRCFLAKVSFEIFKPNKSFPKKNQYNIYRNSNVPIKHIYNSIEYLVGVRFNPNFSSLLDFHTGKVLDERNIIRKCLNFI